MKAYHYLIFVPTAYLRSPLLFPSNLRIEWIQLRRIGVSSIVKVPGGAGLHEAANSLMDSSRDIYDLHVPNIYADLGPLRLFTGIILNLNFRMPFSRVNVSPFAISTSMA
jgi:hypothetical protein